MSPIKSKHFLWGKKIIREIRSIRRDQSVGALKTGGGHEKEGAGAWLVTSKEMDLRPTATKSWILPKT